MIVSAHLVWLKTTEFFTASASPATKTSSTVSSQESATKHLKFCRIRERCKVLRMVDKLDVAGKGISDDPSNKVSRIMR